MTSNAARPAPFTPIRGFRAIGSIRQLAWRALSAARGESLAAFDERCIPTPPQRGCRVGDPGAPRSSRCDARFSPRAAGPPLSSRAGGLHVRTSSLSAAILAITLPLSAQSLPSRPRGANGPAAPTPDLSGVWNGGGPIGDLAEGLAPGETIPILPEAERILKVRQSKDDPQANCLPTGVPRIAPYPWRIVQTPTHIFFLFEANIHSYRQIFMDGRQHPVDPDQTWYGHSIGHWEDDTLVVDTI